MTTPCKSEGCLLAVFQKGWCLTHYTRQRRHGDPNVVLPAKLPERWPGWIRGTLPLQGRGVIISAFLVNYARLLYLVVTQKATYDEDMYARKVARLFSSAFCEDAARLMREYVDAS